MPVEKKHSLLIFFLFFMKYFFRYKLVSYNHASTRGFSGSLQLDLKVTKVLFSLYDRVIFYTQEAMEWAVNSNLLPVEKAYYASNTLNTDEIWSHYNFEINHSDPKVILFIGRLIPNKRFDLLGRYYKELLKRLPDLQLIIIGDGPEAPVVKSMAEKHRAVEWLGAVVDEAEIAAYMRRTHLVFVPGWSGLSIVHAFSYGKPYVTINGNHPPEFVYLHDNVNGLILEGNLEKDCERIAGLLNDDTSYRSACLAAYKKAKELSIENWCFSMEKALTD
jgi:glycosyltransferase involved in cell wall biosynthesis